MSDSGPNDIPEEVPDELVAQAKAAFGQRRPGELAVLTLDSLVEKGAPASDHVLRFEHPVLVIELHVSAAKNQSTLRGTLDPQVPSRVELQLDTGDVYLIADVADGQFTFEPVSHGLVRLHVAGPPDTPRVYTDWFHV